MPEHLHAAAKVSAHSIHLHFFFFLRPPTLNVSGLDVAVLAFSGICCGGLEPLGVRGVGGFEVWIDTYERLFFRLISGVKVYSRSMNESGRKIRRSSLSLVLQRD